MARIALFLTAAAFVLHSCADIIPLTGGDEDTSAPRPVKQSPEQGALLFDGTSAELTFNEFFTLNDPGNTVTMNPSAGKLTTEQKNKTVIVSWPEPLAPNTTYILQLNGTVRDLNENNDSIMQVVFATGVSIDSLSLEGMAVNAYSNQSMKQVSVGLYTPGSDPYKTTAVYATRSDAKGMFRFSYLKDAEYQVFAFVDQNKDQLPQVSETIGFRTEPVHLSDSVPLVLSLFPPAPVHNKLKVEFRPPGLLLAYNQENIDASKLLVNGNTVDLVRTFSSDSVLVALPSSAEQNYRIIYENDTLRKSLLPKERNIPLEIKRVNQNGKWKAGDSLVFRVNDAIGGLRKDAVFLTSQRGKQVPFELVQTAADQWVVLPDPTTDQSFKLHFAKEAVTGKTAINDSVTFEYTTLLEADLSNLKINCPEFTGSWIIELVQNEKAVQTIIKPEGAAFVEFKRIEPGQYGVRCIRDANGNSKWDTGNYATGTQAEEVLRYTLTQKLRANWDVEETLEKRP